MKRWLPFFLILISSALSAQTVFENNPAGLKWQQVNTKHFRVLYPTGFDVQGQRMANTLEHIYAAEAKSLGTLPRKISIVLQNQSSVSNGFVSILPRRSEFFTMPPQDYNFLGTNDWLDLLASHEYRHIVQYQHAKRGFNRVAFYLFGNPTLAGMAQLAAPQWFWEGDAVATETAFTHSGRGKIANFNLLFRTNLLEGRSFNYHKQYLRSYKHNIPNHYVLGYNMISYLRKKTNDPDIWGKVSARSWSVPFIPFAFSNAIKNKSGLYVTKLYNEMAATLKKDWQQEIDKLDLTPFVNVNPRTTDTYTDYLYPQPQEDGSILVMKQGMSDIEQFVLLKDGKEHKIFTPGFLNEAGMLSSASNAVVWNEFGYHPRWLMKNYSRIKLHDIKNHSTRIIGDRRARYGSAALSPQGDRIVTVRSDNNYRNNVIVLELFTGKALKEFPNDSNYFYAMPRWSPDGSRIVVLKTTRKGKTICLIDVDSGTETEVLPISQENVGHPVLAGKYLFFNSPATGIDNIYAIDLESKKRYQVTSSKHGAYNPSVASDDSTLYYNEQTKNGMDVVKSQLQPHTWTEWRPTTDRINQYHHLVEQEGRPGLLDSVPKTMLPVKRYHKLSGIINPYSWGFNVTNDLAQLNAGFASKDILSTTSLQAGYTYDVNERTGMWKAGISYQGLFPVLNVTAGFGDRENKERIRGNDIKFTWRETTLEGGVVIPLKLTGSKYIQELTIGNAVGLARTTSFVNTISRDNVQIYKGGNPYAPFNDTIEFRFTDQLTNGDLTYNHFSLSYAHVLKTSYRDYLYRWGQTLNVDFYNTPYIGDFEGRLLALRGTLYFPGIAKHHYLYTRLAYQESLNKPQSNIYSFRNRIPKPRGYSYPRDETFTTMSLNYSMPIWYPDIAIGPLLNIQRVKLNLFYDYGQGKGTEYYYHKTKDQVYFSTTDDTYQSIGIETTFDINVMRFLPKFEIGFRSVYVTANEYANSGPVFELVIGNIGF